MIGICVISHGNLAEGLLDSCELIMGEQSQFKTVSIRDGDDFEEFKENVFNSIHSVSQNQSVMVFVDLFGASPFNSVLFALKELASHGINIKVITGVNLPMIIEACEKRRSEPLDTLFIDVIQKGKEYIIGLDEKMNQTV